MNRGTPRLFPIPGQPSSLHRKQRPTPNCSSTKIFSFDKSFGPTSPSSYLPPGNAAGPVIRLRGRRLRCDPLPCRQRRRLQRLLNRKNPCRPLKSDQYVLIGGQLHGGDFLPVIAVRGGV